jgi:CheY-like chemotaxis protein
MKAMRVHSDDFNSWLELLERFSGQSITSRLEDLHADLLKTDSLAGTWHDLRINDALQIKIAADPDSVELCIQLKSNDDTVSEAYTAATVLNHLRYRPTLQRERDITTLKILLVEQHAQFAAVVIDQFLGDFDIRISTSLKDAWRILSEEKVDVALISDKYDDGLGLELITSIKSNNLPVKTIAIAAYDESNQKLLDAGADAACGKMSFSEIQDVLKALYS